MTETDPAPRWLDYLPLDEIEFAERNPKGHDLPGIGGSIDLHGMGEVPLMDERTGRLVAGHGRIEALRLRQAQGGSPPDGLTVAADGAWLAPVVRGWRSASDAAAASYLIGSNQWTIMGGWQDERQLADMLIELQRTDDALLAASGYGVDTLDALLSALDEAGSGAGVGTGSGGDDDDAPEVAAGDPVTAPGDVWQCGPHRLMCGNARDPLTVAAVLDGAQVNVAFTSPPYASQRSYDHASGFTPILPDEYVGWFEAVQENVAAHLASDGSWFVNIKAHCEDGSRHLYVHDLVISHVRRWGWRFVDELCWVDSANGFPGVYYGRFKDAWESIFHFTRGGTVKFDALANAAPSDGVFRYAPGRNLTLNDGGENGVQAEPETGALARPSNVITLAAQGVEGHSAAFPVKLPEWFIRAYSDTDDVIFDPFMGSGTTMIAAEHEGRVAYGIELSPQYCDVACLRYQRATGTMPTRDGVAHDFEQEQTPPTG